MREKAESTKAQISYSVIQLLKGHPMSDMRHPKKSKSTISSVTQLFKKVKAAH